MQKSSSSYEFRKSDVITPASMRHFSIMLPKLQLATEKRSQKLEHDESTSDNTPDHYFKQNTSCDCEAQVRALERQLEYLRMEIESQRELAEYHSKRAQEAELINEMLREKMNRNPKTQINPLSVEYGSLAVLSIPQATPRRTISNSKLNVIQHTPDQRQPSKHCKVTRANSIKGEDQAVESNSSQGFMAKRMKKYAK